MSLKPRTRKLIQGFKSAQAKRAKRHDWTTIRSMDAAHLRRHRKINSRAVRDHYIGK